MEELNPEDLLECPYESSHMVRAKRMQSHILACRKTHVLSDEVRCPFNASHIVYEVEKRWHMVICPDRHQVHSKVAEEMVETENRGCVETPAYRPLNVAGDSWEVDTRQSRQRVQAMTDNRPAEVEVRLTEQETKGLNARQRQRLYLKKKAEHEAALKGPPPKSEAGPPSLRPPSQSAGSSRSLALFQQQQQRAAPADIYQGALKGPQGGAVAIGRGRGMALGVYSANPKGGQLLGRGRGMGTNQQNQPPIPTPTPMPTSAPGYGQPPKPVLSNNVGVPMDMSNFQGEKTYAIGRGMGRGVEMGSGFHGGVLGERNGFNNPGGIGRTTAMAGTAGCLGRGVGLQAKSSIPFSGLTSQPGGLPAMMGHMNVSEGGAGRGMVPHTAPFSVVGSERVRDSSDSEDPDQFHDAGPWVGAGGGYRDAGQSEPDLSSSSMSLLSNPEPIGAWADEMEKVS